MNRYETDIVIIGAGPAGLFAVFELGLLGLSAHVVDILGSPGGQCAELYPEKPIYDIPGLPVIAARQLIDNLLKQAAPFAPVFHLGEQATGLSRADGGGWRLVTDAGTEILAKAVVVAAGGGSFVPKRPPLAGIETFEGKSVFYAVRRVEDFRGKRVLIAGGGDSAVDWAVTLAPVAAKLTLVHHRDGFRAAQHSVDKMRALAAAGKIDFRIASVKSLSGADGVLQSVCIAGVDGASQTVDADVFLPFFGLTMKLGPLADFGLPLAANRIPVDPATQQSATAGVFAVGDICTYPGKLKLILSGFHEAALMAQAAFRICRPDDKPRFQYTTSSSGLHQKLGLS